nr:hypothetical protein [Desulfobacterales bacterium]
TPRMHLAGAAVMAGCALGDRPPQRLERLARRLAATGRVNDSEALGILLPAAAGIGERHWGWSSAELLPALEGLARSARTSSGQRSVLAAAALKALMNDLCRQSAGRTPRTLADRGFSRKELDSIAASLNPADEGMTADAIADLFQAAFDGAPVHAEA